MSVVESQNGVPWHAVFFSAVLGPSLSSYADKAKDTTRPVSTGRSRDAWSAVR